MLETDDYYFFFRHEFGQWTLRDMSDKKGVRYNCCEQFMMAQKALLFDDDDVYDKIMAESSPFKQKQLGRQVKSFNSKIWDKNKIDIVYVGNYLKFSQHPDLKQRLIETGDKLLVEASPEDTVWGIGLAIGDPKILDKDNWLGDNLLGEILTTLRNGFKTDRAPD